MTMESNLDLLQNNVEKHREAAAVPQTTVQNDNSVFIGEALNDDEKLKPTDDRYQTLHYNFSRI